MKGAVRIISLVVIVLLIGMTALAQSERLQPTRISAMKANVAAYLNEKVRIDGFVTQFVDTGAKTTSFYYIKDDWGSVVKVRTSKQPPSVGKRYSIEGPVGIDPRTKDLYVSEESRLEIFKAVEPVVKDVESIAISPPKGADVVVPEQPVPNVTDTTPKPPPVQPKVEPNTSTPMYVAIGGAAVIILALVLFIAFRSRPDESNTDFALASTTVVEHPPAPEQVLEGRTIKLHAPPPNTVKLLPGWFEVTGGDDVVKQIRFYKLGGEHGAETTFGRASGRPYAHIQLKAPTVSSRQAKVTFDNGSAQLTNFASNDSNPTKVNGRDLAVNESVPLKESDRVEMGEVALLFHEAPLAANLVRA